MRHFLNDRAGLPLVFALLWLPLGCAPKPKPQPVIPPPPPGDLLHYSGKANEKAAGKVSVRVEESTIGAKKPKVSAFQFGEEHTITELKPDGSMHITGAFINVETLGDTPREKKEGEIVARALQEVKVAYDIDARGTVTNFAAPLSDEYDAKVVSRTRWAQSPSEAKNTSSRPRPSASTRRRVSPPLERVPVQPPTTLVTPG